MDRAASEKEKDGGRVGRVQQELDGPRTSATASTAGHTNKSFRDFDAIGAHLKGAKEEALEKLGDAGVTRTPLSKEECAYRLDAAAEHFAGFGITDDKERFRAFVNDTACVPSDFLRSACRRARQLAEHSFAPSVGEVIKHASELDRRNGRLPPWYLVLTHPK